MWAHREGSAVCAGVMLAICALRRGVAMRSFRHFAVAGPDSARRARCRDVRCNERRARGAVQL